MTRYVVQGDGSAVVPPPTFQTVHQVPDYEPEAHDVHSPQEQYCEPKQPPPANIDPDAIPANVLQNIDIRASDPSLFHGDYHQPMATVATHTGLPFLSTQTSRIMPTLQSEPQYVLNETKRTSGVVPFSNGTEETGPRARAYAKQDSNLFW